MRDDDCVGCQDERRLAECAVVDLRGVDVRGFLSGGLKDIFKGRERFGQVFGKGGRDYFEIGETDLSSISWDLADFWDWYIPARAIVSVVEMLRLICIFCLEVIG